MTKQANTILCVLLSFMLLFTAVGYAAVSDSFLILGEAHVDVPAGLFIVDIRPKGSPSGLDVRDITYASYSTAVTCNLSKSADRTGGSITYVITVMNNTDLTYAYRTLYYQSGNYNNSYVAENPSSTKIGVETDFPNGKIVLPKETLEFEVTYTLGSDRWTFPARNTYTTLLNYQFGINVDSEEKAREVVNDKFLNILNAPSTYLELVDVLDNKFDGSNAWTSNYVGNVGDANSDDAMAVNNLFAGQLQMLINGQVQPATVIIKHENLDNNERTGDDYEARKNGGVVRGYGCEMTLYLTTDSLSQKNGWAPVYVAIFTCDRDEDGNIVGGWYRIGDMYAGQANIVGYNGEAEETGSFVTDNWVAYDRTYSVTANYSYHVAAGTTIKTLMQETDAAMSAEYQSLLIRAKAIMDDLTYAGTGITVVEEAYMDAARFYTLDAAGNPVLNTGITRARLCQPIADLNHALEVAQAAIDKITGGKQ